MTASCITCGHNSRPTVELDDANPWEGNPMIAWNFRLVHTLAGPAFLDGRIHVRLVGELADNPQTAPHPRG